MHHKKRNSAQCVIKDGVFKYFAYQVWNKEAHQALIEGIQYGNPER